ncbi:hypothetical protein ACFYYS_17070 [Streptomyces sp. NPDC002120]|uniref:hypothetical protein n=1 Tax=Streptomyces sp. NPDC002120 TaxID=3364631 RepID=UPI0036CED6A0
MATQSFRRRMSALGTVLGLGIALPFALGATPAYAAAQLEITKTHSGNFAQGGQGTYTITVTNVGNEESGKTVMTDALPTGLTLIEGLTTVEGTEGVTVSCLFTTFQQLDCESGALPAGGGYTIQMTVGVTAEAPCALTNPVTVRDTRFEGTSDSASDPTTIIGGDCGNGGGDGNGGSILPVNLSGVLPMFNNITTNNNVLSPGASNTSRQTFGVNAP